MSTLAHTSRIEELKRRVQQDPASIAFAALAEEYRRAGQYWEAIEVCRAGLQRHPAYLSARVTLGRALLDVGELEEGRQHLEQVLRTAPENLAAIRALAEIHRRIDLSTPDHPLDAPPSADPAADAPWAVVPAPLPSAATPTEAAPPRPAPVAAPPEATRATLEISTPAMPVPAVDRPVAVVASRDQAVLAGLGAFLAAIARARETLPSTAHVPSSS